MNRSGRLPVFASVMLSTLLLALAGCTSAPVAVSSGKTISLAGRVHGGQQPVTGATLQLYMAGSGGDGSAASGLVLLPATTSDGTGNAADGNGNAGNSFNSLPAGFFTLTGQYTCPATSPSPEVYLVARGGNPGLAGSVSNPALTMMAALGPCSSLTPSTNIFIDELTTVASVAALYPYMTGYAAVGSGSGDLSAFQAAFTSVSEYTNTSTGSVPGPSLPASTYASSIEIITLADAVSACINSNGATGSGTSCGALFAATTPTAGSNSGVAPTDVIGALIDILKQPTLNVCTIYGLVPAAAPYQPTLAACPASWSLPISPVTITVSGASSVYVGGTAQYTANVTGVSTATVSWSVNGTAGGNATVGTISSTGLYTPPATAPTTAVTVTATSTVVPSASGSTAVTVLPVTVSVTGQADVLLGNSATYTATVTGNSSQAVSWSVNGVAGGNATVGTITSAGVYKAPATSPTAVVSIMATSAAVTSASGSLGITVSPMTATYATGDSRTVTKPTYPAVCATLQAQFTTSQRSSPPAAANDDTARIQAALNSAACKSTGGSVELAVNGSSNAFFSELITLNGEGLTIDSGVTLYGGATYNTGSYLVYIKGSNSSLNGPGIVDGRGDILTGTTRLVESSSASNLSIYNVTLQQALYPNLYIQGGSGITVWGVTILTPATRANADGIDLDSLTNATVTNSTIEAGDDGVAVKTNSAAATNITVSNNRLYGTHGLSIGSQTFLGVSNVLFLNNYLYGTDLVGNVSADSNGVNIKTDPTCGGAVQQVTYQNTCLLGVKHLIILNTAYGTCSGTAGTPVWSDVIVNGVYATQSVSGAYSQFTGYSAASPSSASLANISLDSNSLGGNASQQYATISLQNSSVTPTGATITTNAFSTPGSVPACSF